MRYRSGQSCGQIAKDFPITRSGLAIRIKQALENEPPVS